MNDVVSISFSILKLAVSLSISAGIIKLIWHFNSFENKKRRGVSNVSDGVKSAKSRIRQ